MSASAQKIPLHFVPAAHCLTGSHMGEEHPELQAQTQMKFRSCTQRLPPPNAEDPLLPVHQVSAPSRVWYLISGAPGKVGHQGSSHRTQQVQGALMECTACALSSSSTNKQRGVRSPHQCRALWNTAMERGVGVSTPTLIFPSPLEAADMSQQVNVFNSWGNTRAK